MILSGQRALVTGAASGIGAACVTALSKAGADVLGADIAPSGDMIAVDVSDAASVSAMFASAGPLDIVVNAAGILIESPTLDMSPEAFDRQIAVNLRGSFLVAQGAVKAMAGKGRLVLIASELAHLGRGGFAAYCASKAGVIGMTRALAHEFAPDLLVNAVAPGPTDTPMLSADVMSPEALALETQNPMGRIGQPPEIAAAVVFLASPGASFMTGQTICPSGGAVML
ncbi:MAG: SDR family NAD(P)-dependent oxidoreductase [Pseudomonadota bacterium]